MRCNNFDIQLELILTSEEFKHHPLIRKNFRRNEFYKTITNLGGDLSQFFQEQKILLHRKYDENPPRITPIEYVEEDSSNSNVYINSKYFETETQKLRQIMSEEDYRFLIRIGKEIESTK